MFELPPADGLILFSPAQERSDVAWHPARKLEDPGTQPKTMRPRVPIPPDIDFGCFAAQCHRPIGFAALTARPASFLTMEETPLEPVAGIGKSSAYPAVGIGRLHLAFRERSHKIGAADDADDPAAT
jgi:hypothetical protein